MIADVYINGQPVGVIWSEPYVLNVKLNLDTDEAEKIIRKYRNDFYKEIAIFKELLDF